MINERIMVNTGTHFAFEAKENSLLVFLVSFFGFLQFILDIARKEAIVSFIIARLSPQTRVAKRRLRAFRSNTVQCTPDPRNKEVINSKING